MLQCRQLPPSSHGARAAASVAGAGCTAALGIPVPLRAGLQSRGRQRASRWDSLPGVGTGLRLLRPTKLGQFLGTAFPPVMPGIEAAQ